MKSPLARWSWILVKWALALGIFAGLCILHFGTLAKVAGSAKDWRFGALGLLLIAGSNLVMFARWWLLVRVQQFQFRLPDAIRYGFVGLAANLIIPGTVGGDLCKALLLVRDQSERRAAAAATVVVDRFVGLWGLFIVGTLALLLPEHLPATAAVKVNAPLLLAGSLGGLAIVALFLMPFPPHPRPLSLGGERGEMTGGWLSRLPVLGPALEVLAGSVKLYRARSWALFAALGMSLVNNSGMIVGLYFCARAMRSPWVPTLTAHFFFRPSTELFGAMSMLPGGIGAQEFAIQEAYVLLNPGTVTNDEAAAAGFATAIAFRAASLCVALVGYCYYLVSRREIAEAFAGNAKMRSTADSDST